MLQLDDPRWNDLRHAYGQATDIPPLLRDLETLPPDSDYQAEPYYTLWSALCHQGDVYSASYAALPHILAILGNRGTLEKWSPLLLAVSIEIARRKGNGPEVPDYLRSAYFSALDRIPSVLSGAASEEWNELSARVAAASIAVAKGHAGLAEAILELEPDVVPEFMNWILER